MKSCVTSLQYYRLCHADLCAAEEAIDCKRSEKREIAKEFTYVNKILNDAVDAKA